MKSYAWIIDIVLLTIGFACLHSYRVVPEYSNYIGIFGTLVLLFWFLRTLLLEGYSMPIGIYIFTRLGLPVVGIAMAIIGYHWFPPKPKKADRPVSKNLDCSSIRYGTFIVNDQDTIKRVNRNGTDYEIHGQDSFEIKWHDCSYMLNYPDKSLEVVTVTDIFGKDVMVKTTDGFMQKRFYVWRKVD